MNEEALIHLAQRFAEARNITLWRVGFLAAGDGKFFARLQAGRTCTLRVAHAVVRYLSERWPADCEWPAGIPRPAPGRRVVRGEAARTGGDAGVRPHP